MSMRTSAPPALVHLARGLGAAALLTVAGCSTDVTRFNLVGTNFLSPASPPAASPVAYGPAPEGRGPAGTWGGTGVQETVLPPASPAPYAVHPRPETLAKAPDRAPPPWSDKSPPPWTDKDPFPWPESPAHKQPAAGPEAPAGWQGRHVIKSGESLYAIAKRHKVGVDELKRVNGITDTTRLWAGKVLLVPDRPGAGAGPAVAAPAAPPRVVQVKPHIVTAPEEPAPAPGPAPKTAAAKQDGTMTDAIPAPAVAADRFRWPARGKVIVGYGPQPDGTKSEGINLAVPLGTDIHAAEAGRVHYAGDGLKGYGNLILIRHANGWASMYAHADQMLVKAGDQVRRGQVIGKSGKSGPVAQPQLHFELRKGSVPVDPLPHLAN
jgi:murein DD-endopeptidase MepM/ murein hydrolase activator NlpD